MSLVAAVHWYVRSPPIRHTPLRAQADRGHDRVHDGIDLLVFTGGIGDNDAEMRTAIYIGLSRVGVILHDARDRSTRHPIRSGALHCAAQVLASQEDEQMTRHAWARVAA